jgi:hypothetical protein
MKKIVMISTFCDTEEKRKILIKNIKKIKSTNLDVMIFTPISLPNEIYDLCDYVILSKENPIFDWPKKAYSHWCVLEDSDKIIKLETTSPDYGYASLNQFKRLAQFSINMDYEYFIFMIYDLVITDEIFQKIIKETKNSFFPQKRNDNVWELGLQLFFLNQDSSNKLINEITEENYLRNTFLDAYQWIKSKLEILDAKINNNFYLEDYIDFVKEKNVFEHFRLNDIKCFVHNNEDDNFLKILFYGFEEIKNFDLKYEDSVKNYSIENWSEIIIDHKNLNNINIEYNGKNYNLLEDLNKVKNSKYIIKKKND